MRDLYCKNCGEENNEGAKFCKKCGISLESQEGVNLEKNNEQVYAQGSNNQGAYASSQGYNKNIEVKNNLVFAILTTIFCCMPFGIVAIVYSAKVDSLVRVGDYQKARSYASNAKTWCIVSLVVGLVVNIIFWGFAIIGILADLSQYS